MRRRIALALVVVAGAFALGTAAVANVSHNSGHDSYQARPGVPSNYNH